jgi:hypothetical protein
MNFTAFALGLMQERIEAKLTEVEPVIKVRKASFNNHYLPVARMFSMAQTPEILTYFC